MTWGTGVFYNSLFLHKAYNVISTSGWLGCCWAVLGYQSVGRCTASRECNRVGVSLGPEHGNRKRLEKLKLVADDPIQSFPTNFFCFEILLPKGHIGGNKRAWTSRSRIGLYLCLRLTRHFIQVWVIAQANCSWSRSLVLIPHCYPLRISRKNSCASWAVSSSLSLIRFPVS